MPQSDRPALCGIIVASLLIALLAASPAVAQKLRVQTDAEMGCALQFSGQIAEGDAALFRRAVAELENDMEQLLAPVGAPRTRICLDSPGGSLPEAVRIAEIIHARFGTAVPAEARCESACSVIFMAGSRSPEADPRGTVTDRVLHPTGRLGFHRLDLPVPEGQYNETVVKSVFDLAIDALAELMALSGKIDMPETLITRMLATPHDDMFYIRTVGQAARWRIAVAPTPRIAPITGLAVYNACQTHFDYITDFRGSPLYSPFANDVLFVRDAPRITSQPRVSATHAGWGQEAASDCEIFEDRADGESAPWGWVAIGDSNAGATSAYELYPFQFYSRDKLIRDLAVPGPVTEPLDRRNADWRVALSGRCLVYSGGRLTEDEPCTAQSTANISHTLSDAREVHRFIWPSGSATVVEKLDRRDWRLNGNDTRRDGLFALPDAQRRSLQDRGERLGAAGYFVDCFVNPATGNQFCFKAHGDLAQEQLFDPWRSSLQILH